MKKVLIALDYDPTAQKVAEKGFLLAKTMGAEVVLLHIIADSKYYSETEHVTIMGFAGFPYTAPLELNSAKELTLAAQKFLDKAKHHLGNEAIETLVKEGDFSESILKTAKSIHADVIVMGSHSRKWLENIVMGSVTEKVLHQTAIPLFIVPTKQRK
jgi:nucleotide-binding universal stress UspA family protein